MARTAPDPLATYNAKRDFAKTGEPAGKHDPGATGNRTRPLRHDVTPTAIDISDTRPGLNLEPRTACSPLS